MVEIDKKALGQRIKSIRLDKGMTLEEFGNLFGASKSNVLGWENGRNAPNKERLKAISQNFNISIERLLYGDFLEVASTLSQRKAKILLENSEITDWAKELSLPEHEKELLDLDILSLVRNIERLQDDCFYNIVRSCSSYSLKQRKGKLSGAESDAIRMLMNFLSERNVLLSALLIQIDGLLKSEPDN